MAADRNILTEFCFEKHIAWLFVKDIASNCDYKYLYTLCFTSILLRFKRKIPHQSNGYIINYLNYVDKRLCNKMQLIFEINGNVIVAKSNYVFSEKKKTNWLI